MERMDGNWFAPGELKRFRRSEYDRLVDLGIFDEQRIELLHGLLVAKEPQGGDHASVASRLHRLFLLALDKRAEIRSHSPFGASDDSEPEPDVQVVSRRYTPTDHPTEAFLLVEVAKGSLRRDRGVKADLYASAGVPEYWVVNLPEKVVEVRHQPENGTYRRLETFRPGDSIQLISFPDVAISVSDFLI